MYPYFCYVYLALWNFPYLSNNLSSSMLWCAEDISSSWSSPKNRSSIVPSFFSYSTESLRPAKQLLRTERALLLDSNNLIPRATNMRLLCSHLSSSFRSPTSDRDHRQMHIGLSVLVRSGVELGVAESQKHHSSSYKVHPLQNVQILAFSSSLWNWEPLPFPVKSIVIWHR